MRSLFAVFMLVTTIPTGISAGSDLQPETLTAIRGFISVIEEADASGVAGYVYFPLQRKYPLPPVRDESEFVERFDEIFDEDLREAVAESEVESDWRQVGWRGVMLNNGQLWMDTAGKITSINYESQKEAARRRELIDAQRQSLHPSIRQFTTPVLTWETKSFRIRLDLLGGGNLRYAAWPIETAIEAEPSLVLENGERESLGNGGNHFYTFRNGNYRYQLKVHDLRSDSTPAGMLEVYKGNELLLSEPVVKSQ